MDVESREHIGTRRAKVDRIEDRSQVDIEWVIPLTGEYLHAAAKIVKALLCKRLVIRHGARPTFDGTANNPFPSTFRFPS
jgi:hypothetical protein